MQGREVVSKINLNEGLLGMNGSREMFVVRLWQSHKPQNRKK